MLLLIDFILINIKLYILTIDFAVVNCHKMLCKLTSSFIILNYFYHIYINIKHYYTKCLTFT